jgi:maleylpyruvate isomerase
MLKLHSYFRSSASYRVRIALAWKQLPVEIVPVHLVREGGRQFAPEFRALNPASLVPVLEEDGRALTQSLAIIEYLDETHPEPPLLPRDPWERAQVRAAALAIACEIHPLNNLRVLRYLVNELGASEDAKNAWYRHWVEQGLAQLEAQLAARNVPGPYACGPEVSLADVVLVPQIFNAQRFECRLDHVPRLMRACEACMRLPAFSETQPRLQPDAE